MKSARCQAASELQVSVTDVGDACVLTLDGALDATTYVPIRDAIIKAVLDEPLRRHRCQRAERPRRSRVGCVHQCSLADWRMAGRPDRSGLRSWAGPECAAAQWHYSICTCLPDAGICGHRTVRRWAATLSAACSRFVTVTAKQHSRGAENYSAVVDGVVEIRLHPCGGPVATELVEAALSIPTAISRCAWKLMGRRSR